MLCDPSRNGYAIVREVHVCATPAMSRNRAESATIAELVPIKMSPPFGVSGRKLHERQTYHDSRMVASVSASASMSELSL